MKNNYRFTFGYEDGANGFVVVFTRRRYCTLEIAEKYYEKLLKRFPDMSGGWQNIDVVPW